MKNLKVKVNKLEYPLQIGESIYQNGKYYFYSSFYRNWDFKISKEEFNRLLPNLQKHIYKNGFIRYFYPKIKDDNFNKSINNETKKIFREIK